MLRLLVPAALLLALLAGAAVFHRLRRRPPRSRLLLALGAAGGASLGICLVGIGAFLVALFEPWPLSLRQGPDTAYARSCFERHLGEAPPASITGIFCREEWGFGGDGVYSIRFSFADPSQIETLARLRELRRVEEPRRGAARFLGGPSWWLTRAGLSALDEVYERGGIESLWVDPAARVAYYQKANF